MIAVVLVLSINSFSFLLNQFISPRLSSSCLLCKRKEKAEEHPYLSFLGVFRDTIAEERKDREIKQIIGQKRHTKRYEPCRKKQNLSLASPERSNQKMKSKKRKGR